MEVNLTDWLGDNAWALWLSLAFLLAVAEILSLDLVLICLLYTSPSPRDRS